MSSRILVAVNKRLFLWSIYFPQGGIVKIFLQGIFAMILM